jgi:hypothetical protein
LPGLAATQFSLKVDPTTYSKILASKETSLLHFNRKVSGNTSNLFKGTYHLTHIDGMERRFYARTLTTSARVLQRASTLMK